MLDTVHADTLSPADLRKQIRDLASTNRQLRELVDALAARCRLLEAERVAQLQRAFTTWKRPA